MCTNHVSLEETVPGSRVSTQTLSFMLTGPIFLATLWLLYIKQLDTEKDAVEVEFRLSSLKVHS